MDPYTIYSIGSTFSMAFGVFYGDSIDNLNAMGQRLTLLFLEEGSGVALIDGKAIPYITPCVFCISEKEHIVIPKSNNSKAKAVFFHPGIINDYLNFENIRQLPKDIGFTIGQDRSLMKFFFDRSENFAGKFSLGTLSMKKLSSLIDTLHDHVSEQKVANWPCRSRSYIMEMLFLLDNIFYSENQKSENLAETISEDFYPILVYIYNNYDKKISVNELTEQFHVSKSTIAKRFQENLGESFLAHLNRMRINMAATMLRDTKLPVNEIMYRVGFSDNVHFLRTFKKYLNELPSNYREKYNWM